MLLIGFAFLAGLVTILSPCILPVLPIVLAGSVDTGKKRPLGIVVGFIASFTFFTLTLSTIVRLTGLPPDILRSIAIVVIALFGASLLIPSLQVWMEKMMSGLAGASPNGANRSGFSGGVLVGLSLGLVWAPCVGPILASVITLAATSTITSSAVFITLAYSIGTALPMFGIIYGGRELLSRVPWLFTRIRAIQKFFGIVMIATTLAMYFNLDRQFQTYILEVFPNYGTGLTKFEDTDAVRQSLKTITKKEQNDTTIGKPMYEVVEPDLGTAPDFIPGGEWINSPPLTMKQLRGKVVLVDFWTYTCINCIRTLPYIKAWNDKYKDKGLVIVGVHTPEFEFEKDPGNVKKAVEDFGITYPVVQDNNYDTWRAYDNHYWPAKYLIDKNGRIRNTHFGEGQYDETEAIIQKLLKETGAQISEAPHNETYDVHTNSLESYLGYDRIQFLSSPERIQPDQETVFTSPSSVPVNTFSFEGSWVIGPQYAMPKKGATLRYHFDATHVYLVMRPRSEGQTARVKILLDGNVYSEENTDVSNGTVQIDTDRLYTLINLQSQESHIIEIQFLDDNADVFAFTFG